jgi:hypothetical protein
MKRSTPCSTTTLHRTAIARGNGSPCLRASEGSGSSIIGAPR